MPNPNTLQKYRLKMIDPNAERAKLLQAKKQRPLTQEEQEELQKLNRAVFRSLNGEV